MGAICSYSYTLCGYSIPKRYRESVPRIHNFPGYTPVVGILPTPPPPSKDSWKIDSSVFKSGVPDSLLSYGDTLSNWFINLHIPLIVYNSVPDLSVSRYSKYRKMVVSGNYKLYVLHKRGSIGSLGYLGHAHLAAD